MASKLSLFMAELKRRKVYRVATVYVVVGAGIIGLGEAALPSSIWEGIQIPVGIIILVGLPIALVLAWAYELKPEESRPVDASVGEPPPAPLTATPPKVTEEEQRKSIVVLPFDNLSPDPDQEYFSDGLTEEVISDLSTIQAFRVISRSSAMAFKGTRKKIAEIAGDLNVQYVLEGSVRKSGNSLRITSQLIDAATDGHLWSEKYTGTLEDVFDIQEKVARAIAEALEVKLTSGESRRVSHRRTTNVHAYECYLRARHALHQYTKEGYDHAIEYIRTGIGMDAESALLHAALAYVYAWGANAGMTGAEEGYGEAETAGLRALDLDSGIAQAHLALGMVYCYMHWDLRAAHRAFEEARALDPSDWDTRFQLALFLVSVGRLSRALEQAQTMVDLDPGNPVGQAMVGYVHMLKGRSEYGLQNIQDAGLDPDLPWHVLWVAWALAQVNRREEALAALEPVQPGPDFDGMTSLCLLYRAALLGDEEGFVAAITSDFSEMARRDPAVAWFVASAHGLLGDTEGALTWLETAVNVGFINYPVLDDVDNLLEIVRADARFEQLMSRVKQEWEGFEA